MRGLLREFRSFDRPIQLLQINQAGINLGFYMLMPYLAQHLSTGAGLAAWTIGLVLGLRNLSQQGMFLIGGTLADRLGPKPMIMLGCALRTVGFALFGLTTSLPWLIVAAAVTGFAGALFNPAARACLAYEAGERKVAAFAVFNVFYQGGILVGPLVGLLLLNAGFSVVCLAAAAIFAVLTVLQGLWLPSRRGPRAEHPPVLTDWRRAFGDRAFVAFAAAMIASSALSYQMYLALPLEVNRLGGGEAGVMALYALSALLGIAGQVRLTAWCSARWSRGQAISRGLALMGLAFVPPAATAHLALPPGWSLAPLVACALLLTLGTLTAFPFEMATIADMAGNRLIGTYYGLYNLLSGLGILAGNLLAGALVDTARHAGTAAVPWIALAIAGLASAAAVKRLDHRGRLRHTAQAAG
ncbi:Predicted arabinose efflux permease, MFS family [Nonomuraea maritima]|uniref:Predicted arabinose efflux permease, MFS family n=1 Tax=Nonomuraea maritima TaxID=683260 RepID=A0A1G9QR48_9ACTN|nr:MFS transporter [Nonomuraea maritima]SDM13476.1 Predicted arabinose efflux permease, MFS family [Nonomuraea maritima]